MVGRRTRVGITALLSALMLAVPAVGTAPAAAATSTELFLSEYIEGSSNNKALEIYNGTGSTVSLGSEGYSVQMFFNGNPTAGLTINLTGTVVDGDVYVLAHSSAAPEVLAEADQANGAGWFNGDDAVVLRKGTTVIDSIGQIGVDPGSEWGSGLASTQDNTLRRKQGIVAGDANPDGPFDPAVEWDGFATNTFDGLGSHLVPALTCPAASGAVGTTIDADVSAVDGNGTITDIAIASITPSDPGTISRSAFAPSPAVGEAATATFTASPDTPAGAYTLTITATNDDIIPETGSCALTITVTVVEVCGDPATLIHEIQGSGTTSPLSGSAVSIEGVVVGDYQGTGQFSGYYIQEEDVDVDSDSATSEGIFVSDTATPVSVGALVRVRGTAEEDFALTQVSDVTTALVCTEGGHAVTPTSVDLPVPSIADWERYEGMEIAIDQDLTVTEVFTLARFGEASLSVGGRLDNPTNVVAPGAPAIALQDLNNRSRILLDDGNNQQNIDPTFYPQGGLSAANTLRVGDSLSSLTGVLDQRFGAYRVQPIDTGDITFNETNPRTASPNDVGGNVKVASFNVLNYFNGNGSGLDGAAGGFPTDRGAENLFEFTRQRAKIISAIDALDADVIGLMELENDDSFSEFSAIEDLVEGLNDEAGAGTYAFVETGKVGTDAISQGIIYRPAAVTPAGDFALLDSSVDERFDDQRNRPAIAQTFDLAANGARFTVVVNHLKSKGSSCASIGDPDVGDGQGNCNGTRTAAAEAMIDWLTTDPTGSGDADVLVMGDLNAYAKEDPIRVFEEAGYVNTLFEALGDEAYSFVFDGQSGYLDHALAGPSLHAQTSGATEWHINADEPIALDYNENFKSDNHVITLYDPGPYRSSDHDPVLVGLDLEAFDFTGFFPPIDNPPALNTVKAGSVVPLQFSLDGDQGLEILAAGSPASMPVACDSGEPLGPTEPTTTPGKRGLTYDASTDTYTYEWKTIKGWTGCRRLVVTLTDSSIHTADFHFR